MFMEKIRRGAKKHRKIMTIVVAALCLGLVASFAIMGGMFDNPNREPTVAEQIAAYESIVASSKTDLETAPNDYTKLTILAEYSLNLSDLYVQNGEQDKAVTLAGEAILLLDRAIANSPADLNEVGQALLIGQKAAAQNICNNVEEARSLFQQALATAPSYWALDLAYINFIWQRDGDSAALDYCNTRTSVYAEGSDDRSTLDLYINILDSIVNPPETTTLPDDTSGSVSTTPATTTVPDDGSGSASTTPAATTTP